MLVTERMQALGDHAKSSRQPPVKERRHAKTDKSAATDEVIVEDVLAGDAVHGAAAPVVDTGPTQAAMLDENAAGIAAIQTVLEEDADQKPATDSIADEAAPQALADAGATQPAAAREDDDTSAAKRAILHEWENWSALHSDELSDPNVAEYFFRHLQMKRPQLLLFTSDRQFQTVRAWLASYVTSNLEISESS